MLGYSAQQTLDVAQSLYEKKLTTYPRTESRYITADMENSTRTLLDELTVAHVLGESIAGLYNGDLINMNQIVNDKKVSDHHAIIPTARLKSTDLKSLPTTDRNILLLIILRTLTAPYAPHLYKATKAIIDIENEDFKATGKEVTQEGFKAIEKQIRNIIKEVEKDKENTADDEEQSMLPPMREGDTFTVKACDVKIKKTQPPKPYTEDTLLSAMETAGRNITDEALKEAMKDSGLGTPATRAGIIEDIIKSGYIERNKKQLLPTETAHTFISLLTDNLKEPVLTAEWEKKLNDIKDGLFSRDAFMLEINEYVTSLVSAKKQEDSTNARSTFGSDREAIGTCPVCSKKVVIFPKSYSCESGKGGCGFTVWKEISGKEITKAQVKKLLEKRKTELIKGFTSKMGKPFDAYLTLNDENKTAFVFESKK